MPPPRHQNPARSGASRGTHAGYNTLNSDSAYSSRAAWHAAPSDIVNPSTECHPQLLPRCVRGAAACSQRPGHRSEPHPSSRCQARTSCELKAMHLVRARGLRCPDIDDGSLHVDKVQLGAYADSTDYAVQRLMECSRPDFRDHALHIFADQSLAYTADRLRNFVIAEDRRCQLLFPLAAEQPDYTFSLDILFRIELVSEVAHERR